MVIVYLDMCAIQRPLDTPDQVRIAMEAEAVLGILALCHANLVELISSEALLYEMNQNLIPTRREYAVAVLAIARITIKVNEQSIIRADQFVKHGLKALDALHLALADASAAEFFCTCDDRLVHRAKRIRDLRIKVMTPQELIKEIEHD